MRATSHKRTTEEHSSVSRTTHRASQGSIRKEGDTAHLVDSLIGRLRVNSEQVVFHKSSQLSESTAAHAIRCREACRGEFIQGESFQMSKDKSETARTPFRPWSPNATLNCFSFEPEDRPLSCVQSPKFFNPDGDTLKEQVPHYLKLFKQLKPDRKGLIKASAIVREAIDPEALQELRPLLEELGALNETLNFMEFVKAMQY
jgi:hypothetical protein